MLSNTNHPRRLSPTGFTLIELIVVMGVIALLLGSTVLVLGSVLQSAREKATRATIFKINGMVEQKMEAINREFERKNVQAAQRTRFDKFLTVAMKTSLTTIPVPQFAINNREGVGDEAWDILSRLHVLRESFPQSFVEICGGDQAPGTPSDDNSTAPQNYFPNGFPDVDEFLLGGVNNNDYEQFVRVLKAMGAKGLLNPQSHDPTTESSELLYLALTEVDGFGTAPVQQAQFSSAEVKDTDGDGLLEFVDGWGVPLRFYRWPTRLVRCGEDGTTGDTNGNMAVDAAGYDAALDPTYASVLMNNLPQQSLLNIVSQQKKNPNARDPNDSFRYIERIIIQRSGPPAQWPQYRRNFEYWFYTPDTFSSFLIVSAGPDKSLGLHEPKTFLTAPPAAGTIMGHLAQPVTLGPPAENDLIDNITNRQK